MGLKLKATPRCVECGEEAARLGGHVHKGKKRVFAGWCKKHHPPKLSEKAKTKDCSGCMGNWKKWHGSPREVRFA